MRKNLESLGTEERHMFKATFGRYGTKRGYKGRIESTILLINVKDENDNLLTDHLWFNLTSGFGSLDLKEGDEVTFYGRVKYYLKGYFGNKADVHVPIEYDVKISHPTKVRKIEKEEE